jgi:MFS family permease
LALLAGGLLLIGLTPHQPVPWYDKSELQAELGRGRELPGENPTTENIAISLPDDEQTGWLGLAWILVAMIPAAIGGGVLHPAINSLITKRVEKTDVGGMLGISSAFLSGANALAPLIGGAIFDQWGSTAPFIVWSVAIGALFVLSLRLIRPGREES